MKEREKGNGFATFLSLAYVAGALALLLWVCSHCYPQVSQRAKEVIGGFQQGQVQQAFSIFSDGLESGQPVRETISRSVSVLFGEGD